MSAFNLINHHHAVTIVYYNEQFLPARRNSRMSLNTNGRSIQVRRFGINTDSGARGGRRQFLAANEQ